MAICLNCKQDFFIWDDDRGTVFEKYCTVKCAIIHDLKLRNDDNNNWPRESALKHKVPVGEIACPHCGAVQHGTLNPFCGICDRPYWKKEDMEKIHISMMTRVVHCEKEEYDIYIGHGTIWGNPFIIGEDGTRKEVIDKYRTYALKNKEIQESLPILKDKVLGCWCKPKACHGDVLVELIDGKGILTI